MNLNPVHARVPVDSIVIPAFQPLLEPRHKRQSVSDKHCVNEHDQPKLLATGRNSDKKGAHQRCHNNAAPALAKLNCQNTFSCSGTVKMM